MRRPPRLAAPPGRLDLAAPPEPADLRLLFPAAGGWIAAAAATGVSAATALGLAALLGCGAVLVAAVRRLGWRTMAVALLCAAAAALSAGVRTTARTSGPLPGLAERRARVKAEIVLTSDPLRLDGRVVGTRRMDGSVFARARVERIEAGGTTWRLRQPVLVFASGGDWGARLPGDRLAVIATVGSTSDAAATLSVRGPPQLLRRTSLIGRAAGRLRAGLRAAVSGLPRKTAGLLPGLVDGDTAELDPQLKADFQRTGMTHLVAVSGSNVAFVLAAALLLARRVRLGPRAAAVLAAVALAMFVVLVRPSPSVLRATFMGAIGLFATVTGRERRALSSLFAAVLVLVLFDPSLARSLGFALSTFASLGLLVLAPGLRTRLSRSLPGWLADAIAVPLAAQVACTPLIAAVSGAVSLSAVPANVLAMPAVALATVWGVIVAFAAALSMPLARTAAWIAGLPTGWLVRVAELFARLPASTIAWPAGWPGAASAVGVLAAALVIARRPALRRAVSAIVVASIVALVGVRLVAPGWPPPNWALVVCDVGQGDAIVARSAGGGVVVIDTGPDPQAVDGCLRDLGVHSVAALLLTHMHADHVEGIPGLLRGRSVGVAQVGPFDEPADAVTRTHTWLARQHVPIERIGLGETRAVGDLRYTVLGPAAAFRGTESDPNNSSLVLSVQLPGLVALLTGDVEEPAQLALLQANAPLRADVLKVPHHGSRKMLAEFAAATGAAVAVTSVGRDNPYGHPAAATMATIASDGMRGYRTDRDGDVAVVPAALGRPVSVTARSGSGTPPARVAPAWTRTVASADCRRLWCPVRGPP